MGVLSPALWLAVIAGVTLPVDGYAEEPPAVVSFGV